MNCACPIGNPQLGRPTILVADREILLRMAIADELRQQGFNVAEAANADEALSILHSGIPIDLMLADASMPAIQDGSSLIAAVQMEYPELKVLIAVPSDDDGLRQTTIDDVVPKPYDVPKVAALIKALLGT
jgi:two-component system, response regulator PdtaR